MLNRITVVIATAAALTAGPSLAQSTNPALAAVGAVSAVPMTVPPVGDVWTGADVDGHMEFQGAIGTEASLDGFTYDVDQLALGVATNDILGDLRLEPANSGFEQVARRSLRTTGSANRSLFYDSLDSNFGGLGSRSSGVPGSVGQEFLSSTGIDVQVNQLDAPGVGFFNKTFDMTDNGGFEFSNNSITAQLGLSF